MVNFYFQDANKNIITLGVIYPECRIILKKSKYCKTLDEVLNIIMRLPVGVKLYMREDSGKPLCINGSVFYKKYVESLSGHTYADIQKKYPKLELSIDDTNTIWCEK